MEYSIEDLIPIVDKLTRKYTSNESSSVTYETARMLMEAVLYCIEEYYNESSHELAVNEKSDAGIAYQCGYDMVVSKVYKSKEIYETILGKFKDYQCRNCRDTIIKGIPAFFINYDPKFKPQDHLLTLDYPAMMPVNALCGVDAIYRYLYNIKIEWDFLSAFPAERIEYLLERIIPDYKNLYFDNISYAVLLTGLGCILAEKPVGMLELQTKDMDFIQSYFADDNVEKAEQKIRMLISQLVRNGFNTNPEMEEYFLNASNDYAVRIVNGIRYHSLNGVFYLNDVVSR
ncbi:MAG: DUF6179 domain-containing protein [Anaerocolumna sp.]